ncbi:glutaredoxin family protein [Salinibacillus xinjiangensis]|uniref:Glutaredoxin family protein n=1 Tax=Salinibacillus xinjiangensis TaxID=1229268 RepID=A0A6G1X1G8_9BACI|nr:glutaredoxin family protein [Salinibacillus xinjiangensis]MRG84725.1 glutaredoxin family protein [Salinibacillus xinjiangensis]
MRNQVNFYTKQNCLLCDEAKSLLMVLQGEYEFELNELDIYEDEKLLEKYHLTIPVVEVNGEELDGAQMDLPHLQKLFDKNLK